MENCWGQVKKYYTANKNETLLKKMIDFIILVDKPFLVLLVHFSAKRERYRNPYLLCFYNRFVARSSAALEAR